MAPCRRVPLSALPFAIIAALLGSLAVYLGVKLRYSFLSYDLAGSSSLYVNCDYGSDSNDGSITRPFLTLTRARDILRKRRKLWTLTVDAHVQIQSSDCYPRDGAGRVDFSLPLLSLERQDSGSPGAVIHYMPVPGASVRLLGGPKIPATAWRPSYGSSGDGVMQLDLGPAGLNVARYGFGSVVNGPGTLGGCDGDAVELWWNGSAMTRARWPNVASNGSWQWAEVDAVLSPLSFTVAGPAGDRFLRWIGQEQGMWIHSYSRYDWADSYMRVASITATATASGGAIVVTIDPSTPPLYGFIPGARVYATNLLCELDAPGEYYIDEQAGRLYFWPPGGSAGLAAAEAFLSVADHAIVSGVTASPNSSSSSKVGKQPGPAIEMRRRQLLRSQAGAHEAAEQDNDDDELPLADPSVARLLQQQPSNCAPALTPKNTLSYVTIAGLHTHFTRRTGISLRLADHVTVRGLDASNHGRSGVRVYGTSNVIADVTVTGTGCEAVRIGGGDELTLAPGGNTVSGCALRRYARLRRTYNPGIAWSGVGNVISDNVISDAPHSGMLGLGVSNSFVRNTLERLCQEVRRTQLVDH